jgi:hypothetical protein
MESIHGSSKNNEANGAGTQAGPGVVAGGGAELAMEPVKRPSRKSVPP